MAEEGERAPVGNGAPQPPVQPTRDQSGRPLTPAQLAAMSTVTGLFPARRPRRRRSPGTAAARRTRHTGWQAGLALVLLGLAGASGVALVSRGSDAPQAQSGQPPGTSPPRSTAPPTGPPPTARIVVAPAPSAAAATARAAPTRPAVTPVVYPTYSGPSPQPIPRDSPTPAAPSGSRVTPAAIDYGPQPVGSESSSQTVTIANTGGSSLHVFPAQLIGSGASAYRIVADTCSGAEVEPGHACTIGVAFAPASRGSRAAGLQVADDSGASGGPPGDPTKTSVVALSGSGT